MLPLNDVVLNLLSEYQQILSDEELFTNALVLSCFSGEIKAVLNIYTDMDTTNYKILTAIVNRVMKKIEKLVD